MFSIKVNESVVIDTELVKRDSISLFYNTECLSTFKYASSSEEATALIVKKIEEVCPYIKGEISAKNYGFSSLNIRTPKNITPTIFITIETPNMDLGVFQEDFDRRFAIAQTFLESINEGLAAFEYKASHTPEFIEREIEKVEKHLIFLKSL